MTVRGNGGGKLLVGERFGGEGGLQKTSGSEGRQMPCPGRREGALREKKKGNYPGTERIGNSLYLGGQRGLRLGEEIKRGNRSLQEEMGR